MSARSTSALAALLFAGAVLAPLRPAAGQG